jgi:hypothetical protein
MLKNKSNELKERRLTLKIERSWKLIVVLKLITDNSDILKFI